MSDRFDWFTKTWGVWPRFPAKWRWSISRPVWTLWFARPGNKMTRWHFSLFNIVYMRGCDGSSQFNWFDRIRITVAFWSIQISFRYNAGPKKIPTSESFVMRPVDKTAPEESFPAFLGRRWLSNIPNSLREKHKAQS